LSSRGTRQVLGPRGAASRGLMRVTPSRTTLRDGVVKDENAAFAPGFRCFVLHHPPRQLRCAGCGEKALGEAEPIARVICLDAVAQRRDDAAAFVFHRGFKDIVDDVGGLATY
jgi:hypothetical protein